MEQIIRTTKICLSVAVLTLLYCIAVFILPLISSQTESREIVQEIVKTPVKPDEELWTAPDTLSIPENEKGRMIHYGRQLIIHTSKYLGPKGIVSSLSNGMNCQNCHLDAGTKSFGNKFSAVASLYPKFRARSGALESIEKRVNDCMQRSLNGKPLENSSEEMKAFIAYFEWVGSNVPKGATPKGSGVKDLSFLERPADPEKGKIIFRAQCQRCHGANGEGKLNATETEWTYPPLWGSKSYNTAAGMYRIYALARFVKINMPFDKPILTDEEAWNVSAYVNSLSRPEKKFQEDWPDISTKPFDHPFGPYADTFTEEQHKYGPFTSMKGSQKKK